MISTYISKISFNQICSSQSICSLIRPFRTSHLFLVFASPLNSLPLSSTHCFVPHFFFLFLSYVIFFSTFVIRHVQQATDYYVRKCTCPSMYGCAHIHERKRQRKSEPFASCSRFFFGSGIGTFEYFYRFVVYSQRISLFSALNTQSPFMRVKFIRKQSTVEPRSILSAGTKKNWDASLFLFDSLNTVRETQKLNIQANSKKNWAIEKLKEKTSCCYWFFFTFFGKMNANMRCFSSDSSPWQTNEWKHRLKLRNRDTMMHGTNTIFIHTWACWFAFPACKATSLVIFQFNYFPLPDAFSAFFFHSPTLLPSSSFYRKILPANFSD